MIQTLRFFVIACGCSLLLPFASCGGTAPSACAPLPDAAKAGITQYAIKKMQVPESAKLTLKDSAFVGDSCYRKLNFSAQTGRGAATVTIYLSPDLRYLTSDLMDTHLDPDIEARELSAKNLKSLLEGDFPSRGPAKAPVTVVMFADFQCPFCGNAAEVLGAEPLLKDGKTGRVAYRHYPLPMHNWAEQAAEATACAQFQNGTSFWALYDQIFANRDSLTPENFRQRLDDLAINIPSLDREKFHACLDSPAPRAVIDRDRALAKQVDVEATPTFFINGKKVQGALTAEELHEEIAKAARESAENKPPAASDHAAK